ncbi:FAD-binding oxidoreductase [Pseudonocardia nematodicida]|uniref:FAD-binding oxidoreductase n=1 Tax=Pseudonocardia nematodicida TaxID=1206997 RepID=A0ABV1K4L4_9PSEU
MHRHRALADLRGDILSPGDPDFDSARQIFNERLVGEPALIVRCAGVADVRRALRYAQAEGLEVSVRGGGHGLGGWASNNGGIVIDLTRLRWVLVDAPARSAWIGGGARAGDVVSETVSHGLVPVTGVTATVGLGGLATGAGEGYLTPQHGYASDNVIAFELVTAAGDVLRVSETERPELFWALRGAGPNFGVVTAMQIRLHPLPAQTVGGSLTFAGADVAAATRGAWDLMENGSQAVFPQTMYGLDADGAPTVTILPGHVGPPDAAAREIDRLRTFADPVRDDTTTMSYVELLHQLDDGGGDRGGRHLWDLVHLPFAGDRETQQELVLSLLPLFGPNTAMELWRTAPAPVPGPRSVLPRTPGVALVVLQMWTDPADDARETDILRRIGETLHASGLVEESPSASNHVTVHDPRRVAALYGEGAYAGLRRLKAVHDPANLFRNNYNVPPAD